MNPLITVIVPTIGRPTLTATLESLARQRLASYLEVLVVADTHNREVEAPPVPPLPFADYRFLRHDAQHRAWGHPQRNFAMPQAHGIWVATLDDDDVWTDEAMDLIVGGVSNSPKPFHVFRMRHASNGVIIWQRRYPSQGNIGTPMMVWKNGTPVGQWGGRYEGDYDFAASTHKVLPKGVDDFAWHEAVIAEICPGGPPSWERN